MQLHATTHKPQERGSNGNCTASAQVGNDISPASGSDPERGQIPTVSIAKKKKISMEKDHRSESLR